MKNPDRQLQLIIAILVIYLVLLFPAHPEQFTLNTLWQLPIELPIIVLALLLVPRSARKAMCALLALLALALLLLRLADLGSYLAFNRRFNPALELHLISDGWNLASTSTGPLQALLIAGISLLLLFALVWFFYRCLLRVATVQERRRTVMFFAATMATLLMGAGLYAEDRFHYRGPVQAEIVPEFNNRVASIYESIEDQRAFVTELRSDTVLDVSTPAFTALQGKDVIIVFVESYGRGYVDAQPFASLAHTRLNNVKNTLDNSGMLVKSAWLSSPIRGGRSWLAHASFQSGLKIDSQARFDRLVTSQRPSFSTLFATAGWHTVGVMPAIQFEWPEGAWYDYQQMLVAEDMQFKGERFGYVTMPDQYTMSHFQRQIREKSDRPLMATLALLTTHAPWTPLPDRLDWDSIGDGSIYDGSHRFGEPINWKYRESVQAMYAQSFDYTLDILGEYAARYGDDAVIVILGDHQPAPIINGWGSSADVPIHIISDDPDIMHKLPDKFWEPGMIPSSKKDSQPMWEMRKTFSTLFE